MNIVQKLCGFVACVLCVFILGPIAFVVNLGRVIRAYATGVPADYHDLRSSTPIFVVFLLLITAILLCF